MTKKILTAYKIQYSDPIILQIGEVVSLGEEETDPKWKGWIWAENKTHKGWIPMQILEISSDKKSGKVTEFYTAKEVDVEAGDTVVVIKSMNGWSWVRNLRTDEEGWVPGEVMRFT